MTILADVPMLGSGLTTKPAPLTMSSGMEEAQEFLYHDASAPPRRLTITRSGDRPRPWYVHHIEREVNRLLALEVGWDGRKAQRITEKAALKVVFTLLSVMSEDSALPQLFPLPDGGVQAEWLVAGDSLEIEADGHGEIYVLATGSNGDTVIDGQLGRGRSELRNTTREFLSRLTERVSAANL